MRFLVFLLFVLCVRSASLAQTNTIQLRNGASSTTIVAPTGGSYTLTLPSSSGTSGQVLTTNGTGTLSWTTQANSATSYVAKTASYTVTSTDYTIDVDGSAGFVTITLPTAVGNAGRIYVVRKSDATSDGSEVVIDGAGAELINGAATHTLYRRYQSVVIQSNGADWNIVQSYVPYQYGMITAGTPTPHTAIIDANLYSSVTVTGSPAGGTDIFSINGGQDGQALYAHYDASHGTNRPSVAGIEWGAIGQDVGLTLVRLNGTWTVVSVATY